MNIEKGLAKSKFFHPIANKQTAYPASAELRLWADEPGFFFGDLCDEQFTGRPQDSEGHILIFGRSGDGKSSGIIKPTLTTYGGPIFALDIKGELSAHYGKYHREAAAIGKETRPFKVLDFMEGAACYDAFWFLSHSCDEDLMTNIMDLAMAFIPNNPEAKEPFWYQSAQAMLAAELLHCYLQGMSFAETIEKIAATTLLDFLCEIRIVANRDDETDEEADKEADEEDGYYPLCDKRVKMLVGMAGTNMQQLASFDREIRNVIVCFAADARLMQVFRGKADDPDLITWDDLDIYQIFLRVPDEKMDIWAPAVKLVITQLLRYLHGRPDKHDPTQPQKEPVLLIFDEFPRLGKVESILSALATLRYKGVSICLSVQSIAQLDMIYGKDARRVILDNCAYKVILGAGDPETQRELSNLIGNEKTMQRSINASFDEFNRFCGASITASEHIALLIQPHLLATISDVLLISPYGLSRLEKFKSHGKILLFPPQREKVLEISPVFNPIKLTKYKKSKSEE